jgi:hypothetical protein
MQNLHHDMVSRASVTEENTDDRIHVVYGELLLLGAYEIRVDLIASFSDPPDDSVIGSDQPPSPVV